MECGEGGAGGEDSPPIRVGVRFLCSTLSLHTAECTASVQHNENIEVDEASSAVHANRRRIICLSINELKTTKLSSKHTVDFVMIGKKSGNYGTQFK